MVFNATVQSAHLKKTCKVDPLNLIFFGTKQQTTMAHTFSQKKFKSRTYDECHRAPNKVSCLLFLLGSETLWDGVIFLVEMDIFDL